MQRHTYNASTIQLVLERFEAGYRMSSDEFYQAHVDEDERLASMPGAHRQAWAAFYRTRERMASSGFADRVSRELELA